MSGRPIPATFQAEDPVPQGIHDVVEGCLVRHVEEILLVGVAGDVLDLTDEGFGVLLPTNVVPEDLGRQVVMWGKVGRGSSLTSRMEILFPPPSWKMNIWQGTN